MRVRPFFWVLLISSCLAVVIFAAVLPTHTPALLQVRLDQQHPTAHGITTLSLRLIDPEGTPIERAHVVSSASMTNMNMVVNQNHIEEVRPGDYIAKFQLYMSGPWAITFKVQAQGFIPLNHVLLVQVT